MFLSRIYVHFQFTHVQISDFKKEVVKFQERFNFDGPVNIGGDLDKGKHCNRHFTMSGMNCIKNKYNLCINNNIDL